MSSYSNTRPALSTDRRSSLLANGDRQRVSTSAAQDDKQQARSGFGVNAADRQPGRRDPFKTTDGARYSAAKPKEVTRPEYSRGPPSARRLGNDAARGTILCHRRHAEDLRLTIIQRLFHGIRKHLSSLRPRLRSRPEFPFPHYHLQLQEIFNLDPFRKCHLMNKSTLSWMT